jgi:hypothetical protein
MSALLFSSVQSALSVVKIFREQLFQTTDFTDNTDRTPVVDLLTDFVFSPVCGSLRFRLMGLSFHCVPGTAC